MPTVIDSLFVELGLDARKFVEGSKESEAAIDKSKKSLEGIGKQVEAGGRKISDLFSIVKGGAVGIIAALGGGAIASFVDQVAHMDNATGRMAKTIGTSIERLSTWQGMIRMIGGDAGSATSALAGLQNAITNMLQGGGMLDPGAMFVLNQIGGVRGKTTDQIMRELSTFFDREIKSGRETPTGASVMLGRLPGMNKDMIDLILKGPEALGRLEDAAKKAGVASEESAARSAEYVQKLNALSQAWENLARKMIPVLTSILEIITSVMGAFEGAGFSDERKERVEKLRRDRAEGKATIGSQFRDIFSGGIPVKPGAGAASPETQRLMEALSGVSGIKEITALNDMYHQFLGKGAHTRGQALDLSVKDPKNAEAVAAAVRARLAELGISATVINEYDPAHRSPHATGGHIHIGPVGARAAAQRQGMINNRGGDVSTSTTQIGQVIVNTRATDAQGMARDFVPAIQNYARAMPANSAQV